MASNSQAMRLGYLLSPHIAFQGHAAHTARWPAMLSPNGSSGTCIPDGVYHIPMPCLHGATYPPHYRMAFASSILPLPHAYRLALRLAFPRRRRTGFPCSVSVTAEWVRRALSTGSIVA